MNRTSKRNPQRGFHPDLSESVAAKFIGPLGPSKTPSPAKNLFGDPIMMLDAPPGMSPIFVPISEVDPAELAQMPRAAFTNEEWDELDEDIQEEIEDNDTDSQERVDELALIFIDRWRWENDGSNRDFSNIEESFEYWLQQRPDNLWKKVPARVMDEMPDYAEHGASEAQFHQILNEVMSDTNNYAFNPGNSDRPQGSPIWDEKIEGYFVVDSSDFKYEFSACTPDEAERAVAKIAKKTEHTIDVSVGDLTTAAKKGHEIEQRWDTGDTFDVYAEWDKIAEAVAEALQEIEIPDDLNKPGTPPPEERVVYRWPDGFYVQDLVPSELPAEGKTMGMCVGQPSMGYGKAVRNGEIKILSLRRPSGKPLFTIEAGLSGAAPPHPGHGKIDSIDQIKGKANRLPGFDLGKAGMPYANDMKRDEVERIFEFVEMGTPVTVDNVDDLRPSRNAVRFLYMNDDAWATRLIKKVALDKQWGDQADLIERHAKDVSGAEADERDRAALRGNPGRSCGIHGEKCGGFCAPYKRRRR